MLGDASKRSLRKLLWLGAGLYLLVMALSLWVWAQLPNDALVPIHYGIDMQPDRYAHKDAALLWMPQLFWPLTLLVYWLPRVEPRGLNLDRSIKAYVRVLAAILIFMAVMLAFVAYSALQGQALSASFFAILLGALFAVLGNYLGKVRSNFFMGIKTPWTLSSDLSWQKTHRLTGRLFVLFGVELLLGGLLFNHPLVLILGVGGILLSSVYAVVYSYLVWRGDPDKRIQ